MEGLIFWSVQVIIIDLGLGKAIYNGVNDDRYFQNREYDCNQLPII